MAANVQTKKDWRMFTTDLMTGLGADDDEHTKQTVASFNNLIRFWSLENRQNMESFLNRVRSHIGGLSSARKEGDTSKAITSIADTPPKELRAKLQECEKKLQTSQTSVKMLQGKLNQLKPQPTALTQVLGHSLESYKSKCRELVCLQDEYNRYSLWFNERIRSCSNDVEIAEKKSAEMEREVSEIKQKWENAQQTELHVKKLLGLLPDDAERKLCSVPTLDGELVLLKTVYTSWKKEGVPSTDCSGFPPFKTYTGQMRVLADPVQVQLVHDILKEFVPSLEPPFKIQFRPDEKWLDLAIRDQIRIASVMFGMRRTVAGVERRLVHYNRLLITISMDLGAFKFSIKAIADESAIPSRMIVMDGTFELT